MLLTDLGKILLLLGGVLVLVGLLLMFTDRIPLIGRLPGDVVIRGKNFVFYFPIVTSLLISGLLTLLLWLISRR